MFSTSQKTRHLCFPTSHIADIITGLDKERIEKANRKIISKMFDYIKIFAQSYRDFYLYCGELFCICGELFIFVENFTSIVENFYYFVDNLRRLLLIFHNFQLTGCNSC